MTKKGAFILMGALTAVAAIIAMRMRRRLAKDLEELDLES